MTTCILALPYPPSVNHYKRVGRTVHTKSGKRFQIRVNTAQTNKFLADVQAQAWKEGVKSFGSATISVKVLVFPPDKRKRDLDNILKVLLDSLQNGGLFDNDHQIARLHVERKSIIPKGQVIVTISQMETQNDSLT